MRYLFFFLLFAPFFFGFTNNNKKITRVAIIDTGLNVEDPRFKDHLCPEVGEDFTGEGLTDIHGHGTHVAGLIKQYAGNVNYCLIILKYFSIKDSSSINTRQYLSALDSLNKYHPDVVNLSVTGPVSMPEERAIITNLSKTKFFVAAGNEGADLDLVCDAFPACYAKDLKNVTVVGNLNAKDSNHGSVVGLWINGTGVESTYPYTLDATGRHVLSGTSMSTAIATGKYIYERN